MEVLIAATVLVVALAGALGGVISTSVLGDTDRESTIAYQAARRAMEGLQAADYSSLVQRYNDNPDDDPSGVGTAPGAAFDVFGLDPQPGDPDGRIGRILLPLSADGTLRETIVDPLFGMPRDLSGNGVIDGADHQSDHVILPVRVRVEWRGQSGDRFAEYSTILGMRR